MSDWKKDLEALAMSDQQDAENETETREDTAWELHVADERANIAMKTSHETHTKARAEAWEALALLLNAATVVGVLLVLTWAITSTINLFT